MSFKCYYKVDFDPTIFVFEDDYNYEIWDECERESLFTMLGSHHYGYDPELWNNRNTHEIIVCLEDGTPVRGMIVEMYMEPTFDAYEKFPKNG